METQDQGDKMGTPNFRATPAALGYAYQVRYGLLEAWRTLAHTGYDWSVFVESADDVVKETSDSSHHVQLKNRSIGSSLTDSSADLWKTLRIWSLGIFHGTINAETTSLFLITTSQITQDSAGSYLTPVADERDEPAAIDTLNEVAATSSNKDLTKSFSAWTALQPEQKRQLISRIQIVGSSSRMDELEASLRNMAASSVRPNRTSPFLERLEGWWNQRVIEDWLLESPQGVSGIEFADKLEDIRSQMSPDNLPVDPWISELDADGSDYSHKVFVRQLALAGIKERRTTLAIRDWLRAVKQRSMWSREGLVQFGELGKYDAVLFEEWQHKSEALIEDLGEDPSESDLMDSARKIYLWAEEAKAPPIRRDFSSTFITRGSFHILADDEIIGWHPLYTDLLPLADTAGREGPS